MHKIILQKLQEIEKKHNVIIHYAIESGSRCRGFPSQDSDYDVRFIYSHTKERYLSIEDKRDVIEVPINDDLDISWRDIKKALQLFRKTNPPLLERLRSPIIYQDDEVLSEKMRELLPVFYNKKSCIYHYISMAKRNFDSYLQKEIVNTKKYFYVLRPILACLRILQNNWFPPVEFPILVDELVTSSWVKKEINILLQEKMAWTEQDNKPKNDIVHKYIIEQFEYIHTQVSQIKQSDKPSIQVLDKIFQDLVLSH